MARLRHWLQQPSSHCDRDREGSVEIVKSGRVLCSPVQKQPLGTLKEQSTDGEDDDQTLAIRGQSTADFRRFERGN